MKQDSRAHSWGPWLLAALVPAAFFGVAPAQAQNLIVNGSFEFGTMTGTFRQVCPGSGDITGWSVVTDCVDYSNSLLWQVADGQRNVDLDARDGDAGGLEQSFTTTPGATYVVRFSLAGNPVEGPTIKQLRVSAAGQQADFTFDVTGRTPESMGAVEKQWAVTAASAITTLRFQSRTSPSGYGPVIDDVRVYCAADLAADGLVDFSDYLEFLNLYDAQDTRVDFNMDGLVDFSDYLEFLNLYEIGC